MDRSPKASQGDKEFSQLTEADKKELGCRLEVLLNEVTEGALVPLINSLLSRDDVEKLAQLKGIPIDNIDSPTISIDLIKEEESSDISLFENIPIQSSNSQETVKQENDCDSNRSAIISKKQDFTDANISNDFVKKEEPTANSHFENNHNQGSKNQEIVKQENVSDSDSSSTLSCDDYFQGWGSSSNYHQSPVHQS